MARRRFETLDGKVVEFTVPEKRDGLTPKQQADLEQLYAWCKEQDRQWAERAARGGHILKGKGNRR